MQNNRAGDIAAGVGAGLAYLPIIVVVAFLAFGSLGPQTATAMSAAAFAANIIAGLVVLLLARSPLVVGLTSGTSAIVVAGLFSGMAARGNVPDVADVMAITLCIVAVSGIVQLVLVWFGAAALGPLAPYPVVAGLVNGTALLVLLSQLPALERNPAEILVAAATAVVLLRFPLRWKIPPVLPAVAAGLAVFAVLQALGVQAGAALYAMPSPVAYPAMAAGAYIALAEHAPELPWHGILAAGVTVALLGMLEGLATVSALTDAGIPTDGRRDLRAVGVANLVVAATAGGPPIGAPVATALGLLRMGGTGHLASICRLATVAAGGVALGPFLPFVPHGALVGLVLSIGWRLIDPEPLRLLWRAARQDTPHRLEIAGSALVSLAVVAVAVVAGLAVAVAVGAMACLLLFTAAMAGSAVRRVFDGAAALSRVRRSAEETATLLQQREAVAVLELAGPLFFGNVSPLRRALEQAQRSGARHVVIDLSRIVRVDLSGARRLISIVRQYREKGLAVVLAPIRPGHPVADYLDALGVQAGECFGDVTEALAATESTILAEAGVATPCYVTAAEALEALGVPRDHARTLAERTEIRDLEAGDALCHAGASADEIYVLMQGKADVLLPRLDRRGQARVVLAHLSAGTLVGERALFEAGTRNADVVCTVRSRVMILSGATLAALKQEASPAALALVLAITHSTSVSLQHANAAIERLEV